MEYREAERHVREVAREWAEANHVAVTAAQTATGLIKILTAYTDMFPQLVEVIREESGRVPQADDDAPKGAEAVRVILQESPDATFYVSELVSALRDRGWLPDSDNPANAVRAALERLVNSADTDIKKWRDQFDKVVYSYRPDDAPPTPAQPVYADEEPF